MKKKSKKDTSETSLCGLGCAYFHNGRWSYAHCLRDKSHNDGPERIFHDMNSFEPSATEAAALRKQETKFMLDAQKLYPDSADYSRLIDPNEI